MNLPLGNGDAFQAKKKPKKSLKLPFKAKKESPRTLAKPKYNQES